MTGVPDSAKWLSLRIDLDFEKVSLDNVLKYIAEVLPSVSIIVDPYVAACGIDLSTRVVDFKGKAVAVGDVLDVILSADLAYVPRAGHLLITTSDRLYFSLECKTYAVGVTCRWPELLRIVQQAVNNVADRYVAPWLDEGGPAAIEYGNGVLVVTQTYRGHQQIAGLLEQLHARGFFDAGQHADKTSGMSEDAAKTTVVCRDETLAAHIREAAGPRKEGTWNVVPILCPYDGRLAEALRRICPNVREAHEELGSLRDYKQAIFVHSLPVIMEMPPDPWFYSDASPRPCVWNDLTDADLAKGEQLENIQWDSQPVPLFAGECERAGKPLALGQWSDPFRIGRDWQSQTGFLEEHQHHDLAGGIVQGRFLAVAFVEQVLVDPRFKVWCALWEQYRKSGEVPVLEHEKAAREWGAVIPERRTIWDHLPYVIGLSCPRMYTATALHYLLPVREEGVVDYGPVCSEGIAFDFRRASIGEPFHNLRPADEINWLSDDEMKVFGPVEVMVDAAGSEVAVARMYDLVPSQVRVLPLITSQAGDWLAVAFRVGQGEILLLPECKDLESKAEMIRLLATELWDPIQAWLGTLATQSPEQASASTKAAIGSKPGISEDRGKGDAFPPQPSTGQEGGKPTPMIHPPEYRPGPGEDWSIPMSVAEIARRIEKDPRTAQDLLAKTGLWKTSRQNWRVRLDTLAPTMKKKVTTQPKGITE